MVRRIEKNKLIVCDRSIFSKGKVQLTGAPSETFAENMLKSVCRRLKYHLGYKTVSWQKRHDRKNGNDGSSNFKVGTLMATAQVPGPLNLHQIDRTCPEGITSIYEPERFPAVIMRHQETTIDVFASGKLNLKGPGKLADMGRALADLLPFFSKNVIKNGMVAKRK